MYVRRRRNAAQEGPFPGGAPTSLAADAVYAVIFPHNSCTRAARTGRYRLDTVVPEKLNWLSAAAAFACTEPLSGA